MKSSKSLTAYSADEAWRDLLSICHTLGADVGPRGFKTKELLSGQSVIRMRNPLILHPMRNLSYKHAVNEALWILTGSNQLSMIQETAPSYHRFSDDDMTLQGAYGPPVTEQMRYVVDTLAKDLESRQAIISIWRPNPRESKDIPCTLSLQFLIRDNAINCVATMRSSDLWLGYPYDVFCFTMITTMVAIKLNMALGLSNPIKLGYLILNAGSQHIYEKDLNSTYACTHTQNGREISDMSLHGLNTPDNLLNALYCGVNADIQPNFGNNPFFADVLALIAEEEGA